MNLLDRELINRRAKLEKIIHSANQILQRNLPGNLEVTISHGKYSYSLGKTTDGKHKRQYIKKSDVKIAKMIAQRDYAEKMISSAQKELNSIISLQQKRELPLVENLFAGLHPGRRILVSPYEISDEEYAKKWLNAESEYTNSYPIHTDIITERGEQVRSKSEKIIADKLFYMNIPYRYEFGLMLGGELRFPDFTVLNPHTRNVFIWEHLGRIDKPDYLEKNMSKIRLYEQHGFVPNVNLILTFETSDSPLSVKAVNRIIDSFFCM